MEKRTSIPVIYRLSIARAGGSGIGCPPVFAPWPTSPIDGNQAENIVGLREWGKHEEEGKKERTSDRVTSLRDGTSNLKQETRRGWREEGRKEIGVFSAEADRARIRKCRRSDSLMFVTGQDSNRSWPSQAQTALKTGKLTSHVWIKKGRARDQATHGLDGVDESDDFQYP